MRTCSLGLLLLVWLLATPLAAAPAPFPRPGREGSAEAVLQAGTSLRVNLARQYLGSRLFLKELLRAPEVRAIPGLARAKDGQAWLRKRLKVTEGPTEGLVRVRVVGCARREALPILRAVLCRVTGTRSTEGSIKALLARREEALARMLWLARMRGQRRVVTNEDFAEGKMQAELVEFVARPLRIHQGPR
jgi:hypothetical protein